MKIAMSLMFGLQVCSSPYISNTDFLPIRLVRWMFHVPETLENSSANIISTDMETKNIYPEKFTALLCLRIE